MLFNSFHFLVFFPIVLLLYFILPKKVKYLWLLAASYYFYMSWNAKYIVLILFSTIVTFLGGLLIDRFREQAGKKKAVLAATFVLNLSLLAFFKYFDFLLHNLNLVLGKLHITVLENPFDFVLPVGISFYTFQALSYAVDVYRGDIRAEKNFLKYALFVSFFPQLVAGPIERSKNLLSEINDIENKKMWDYDRIVQGMIIILYGLFLKLVIADRISIMVDSVFSSYKKCDPVLLLLGAIGFSIQIYCDFSSYSTIAIGAAKVLGFSLMENFDTPYFSRSIKEFWRRWHISLSTWFRDYLYIPLGGNRKGKIRKYGNLLITFLVSGLWHGAGWHYIIWGFLHGFYQVVGDLTLPVRRAAGNALGVRTESLSYKFMQMVITDALVVFAWIFFRADSFRIAAGYIRRMVTGGFSRAAYSIFTGGLFEMGLDRVEWSVLLVGILVMALVGLIKYNMHLRLDEFLGKEMVWLKWLVIYFLFFAILIFGNYGPQYDQQAFIYFQF